MKPLEEVVCAVIDAGTFPELAITMSRRCKKTYYHSPFEREYLEIESCVIGDGLETVRRLDEFMDPDVLKTIDLFVFPDRGFSGHQRYLRSIGKAVWGGMGFCDYELYRTRFIRLLNEVGLEQVKSVPIRGLTRLADHLKQETNKWVKINRYRGNLETFKHRDWAHTIRRLEKLRVTFGGMSEYVTFIVQDEIEGDEETPVLEVGYDGWNIDGDYPSRSFQGYEKKNQLYLGSLRDYDDLPEQIVEVNRAISPLLKSYGYRNFWATEIRILGDHAYFIDPTPRMPGQTGEQLLETCKNLPEVIWHGAHGELVEPEFLYRYAAEATLHCEDHEDGVWKVMRLPEDPRLRRWFKLYQFCKVDGLYHFPPSDIDETGVVLGVGQKPLEAIEHLKENVELISDEPISVDFSGFLELLEQIEEAEGQGVPFADDAMPAPSSVLTET